MEKPIIATPRLRLIAETKADASARIAAMEPEYRAAVSAQWLSLLHRSKEIDPWIHGFVATNPCTNEVVGVGGFKGPPQSGVVEIAYGIEEAQQGKGYATELAAGLVEFARQSGQVVKVIAHTLPNPNASTRVLTKCGFTHIGDVEDPEDGTVWRWERKVEPAPSSID